MGEVMNITFLENDRVMQPSYSGSSEAHSASNSAKAAASYGGALSLDINSAGIHGQAYKGQGKTMKDVTMSADSELMTLDAQRDYMAVMSNCMSSEDFNRMQEEGFNPGDTEFKDTVTIIDHIKASLVQSGEEIVGYTDTISQDALEEITGSEAYANELRSQFSDKDIPLTSKNVIEVQEAFDELSQIGELKETSIKYLVENELAPSVENLYTAAYSSGNDVNRQGHGYYAAGEVSGYYAKKPDEIDLDMLKPQLEKIVNEAGYETNDENINRAAWLVEKGIPLTKESFKEYMTVVSVSLPMDYATFADHATNAISDGIRVKSADLSKKTSLREEAYAINNEVQSYGTIHGRRVLEEVRLSMTAEANLKLLRSGYSIDTAPMEDLVKKLKEIEKEFAINLTGDGDEIEAVRKKDLYDSTVDLVEGLKNAPISISLAYEKTDELSLVSDKAAILKADYDKAQSSYESLMTAPRRDMGDSIQKAFQNVDDILKDLDMPLSEMNRRAVRILGYNNIEITKENLNEVADKDNLLTKTLDMMTPGRVLNMIRDGKNPLIMNVNELNEYLGEIDTTKDDLMSYSKFLYQLEQNGGISEDERSAYIGIYRLVNQIEKSDYSSIGAVEASGIEFNLNNMLSSLRSRRHKAMDYKIDDSFGGVDAIDRGIASITTQIAKGYIKDASDLKAILEDVADEKAAREFDETVYDETRKAFDAEASVLEQLSRMDMPVTANNLIDMEIMMNAPGSVFKRLKEIGYKKNFDIKLESKEEAKKSYESEAEEAKEFLEELALGQDILNEEVLDESIDLRSADIRQIAQLYQHMDFLKQQSQEENYEIPANINGELTAINLKVIHSDNNSEVTISFETSAYGKVGARIESTAKGWELTCGISRHEGYELLSSNRMELSDRLQDAGISLADMHFIESKGLDLNSFNKVVSDRKTDTDVVSTDELYHVAKEFISFVNEIH